MLACIACVKEEGGGRDRDRDDAARSGAGDTPTVKSLTSQVRVHLGRIDLCCGVLVAACVFILFLHSSSSMGTVLELAAVMFLLAMEIEVAPVFGDSSVPSVYI